MTIGRFALVLTLAVFLVTSPGSATQTPRGGPCSPVTAESIDDCVRLNEIHVLGTHNSYHIAPAPTVLARLGAHAREIEYTHRPLVEQLSQFGIRKFELDVFADPEPRSASENPPGASGAELTKSTRPSSEARPPT